MRWMDTGEVVSASTDSTLRLWDLTSQVLLCKRMQDVRAWDALTCARNRQLISRHVLCDTARLHSC